MTRRDQLRDWLDAGPHRPDDVTRIARAVCNALAHRHETTGRPIYLAPERVTLLQTSEGRATALFEGVESFENDVAAPEGASGGQVGAPSDLYAVGLLLYEALTGQRPAHNGELRRPSAVAPDRGIPQVLDKLVVSLLSVDPAQRPTAADTLGVLDEVHEVVEAPAAAATKVTAAGQARGRQARKTGESDFSMSFFAFGEKLAAEERTAYAQQVDEDLRRERTRKRWIAVAVGTTLVSLVVAILVMRDRDEEEAEAIRKATDVVESRKQEVQVAPPPQPPPTPTPTPTPTPIPEPVAEPAPAPPQPKAKPAPEPAAKKPAARKPAPKKPAPKKPTPAAKPKPSSDPTPDWAK